MRLRLILIAAAAVSLASCTHDLDRVDNPSFGAALNTMVAAQTDPTPPSSEPPESSGAVGARAVDAYNAGAPAEQAPTINMNINTTSTH